MVKRGCFECGNLFESQSGLTIDYQNGICCFSVKHAVLGRTSKAWNQYNVFEWSYMSTCRLSLFLSASTIEIQFVMLV